MKHLNFEDTTTIIHEDDMATAMPWKIESASGYLCVRETIQLKNDYAGSVKWLVNIPSSPAPATFGLISFQDWWWILVRCFNLPWVRFPIEIQLISLNWNVHHRYVHVMRIPSPFQVKRVGRRKSKRKAFNYVMQPQSHRYYSVCYYLLPQPMAI